MPTRLLVLSMEKMGCSTSKLNNGLARTKIRTADQDLFDELADELYLAVLSRHTTEEERSDVVELVEAASDRKQRREIVRQIVWGQLLSAEFRLNH